MYSQPFHQENSPLHSSRFLVTGGAGFIGSHIVEYLLKYGAEQVVVLDNLLTGSRTNLLPFEEHSNFAFIEGDLRDEEVCQEACQQVDYVFHQAALGSVPRSIKNPGLTHDINITGSLNLLKAAHESEVKRLIVASSSSIYGDDDTLPKQEGKVGRPLSPYAVSKRAVEHYARVFHDLYNLEVVLLRYFNVFGPRQNPEGPYAAVIPKFITACLQEAPITVHGDGEQTRDFTYIDDIVEANLTLLETDAADGETMNVGSTGNITIEELAKHVIEETGADVEPIYEAAKEGDARHTHADVTKARDLLGYEPSTDIREGVSRFIRWYQANRDWYEPLVLSS
jgi:UDP-glucose 4-epimerase